MTHWLKISLLAAFLILSGLMNAIAAEVPQSREQIHLSFAPLVKQSSPAVVNIYTKKVVQTQPDVEKLFNDPVFKRFFGNKLSLGQPREKVQNSLGSGVIVQSDGVVITNNHVIKGADEIRVVMMDKREFDADLIMVDERTDIAVLRMRGVKKELPFLTFGDSDELLVGDLVLAIGNPFGVGQTITSGIVSGLARSSVGVTDFQSFIQTDAAINPGNSGGALVSLNGEVVGINTIIFSKGGGSLGIGFAVPSNMVRVVVESALQGKRLVRPWLGFAGRDVSQDIADALGLDRPSGVIVESVYKDGPAEDAGLQAGDIILSVDNHQLESAQDLRYRMATKGTEQEVAVSYLRDDAVLKSNFAIMAPPETPVRDEFIVSDNGPLQGVKVMNLSPALSDELGIETDQTGVMIVEIGRRSTATRLGLLPGDKLVSINDATIDFVADLRRFLTDPPSEWHLVMSRNGRKMVLDVR